MYAKSKVRISIIGQKTKFSWTVMRIRARNATEENHSFFEGLLFA